MLVCNDDDDDHDDNDVIRRKKEGERDRIWKYYVKEVKQMNMFAQV